MKLVYTEQAIVSLQECLNFLAAEISAGQVNEVRDKILAKADKLLENPYILHRSSSRAKRWDVRLSEGSRTYGVAKVNAGVFKMLGVTAA